MGEVHYHRRDRRRTGGSPERLHRVHEITIAKFIHFGVQDLVAAETSLSMLGQFSNEAPAAIPLSGWSMLFIEHHIARTSRCTADSFSV